MLSIRKMNMSIAMTMITRIKVSLICICILGGWFSPTPVFAQADVAEAEDDLPESGSGALGRFTLEEAQAYALRVMSGEVIGTDVEREQGDQVFYEYLIRRPDGSIFEVEIDATSGELYEIEVERLGRDPIMPFETLSPDAMEAIAVSYVREKSNRVLRIRVVDERRTVYQRKLAHLYDIKQSSKVYRVIIDAIDGRILSHERID